MAGLTLDTQPAQAIDMLNNHNNSGNLGKPVGTAGIEDYAVTEPKMGDDSVSSRAIQDEAVLEEHLSEALKTKIDAAGSGGVPGVTNYIAEGMNITPGTGLQVNVSTGRASIGEKVVQLIQTWAQSLDPRMAALLYQNKDGSIGKVNAISPLSFIDNNTVAMWVFNQTVAGAHIANAAYGLSTSAYLNDLIPAGGLSSVDGWNDYAIKGDGTSGYYVSANSNGFPVGAAVREDSILIKIGTGTGTRRISQRGSGTNGAWVFYRVGTRLCVNNNTTNFDTGYDVAYGGVYRITTGYTDGKIYFRVNGTEVYTIAATLNTSAAPLTLFGTSEIGDDTYMFYEMRTSPRTLAEEGRIANKLCLPCSYTGYSAEYPTVAEAGYHEWRYDEPSGSTVADSAGTLNGTATGSTIVDSQIGLNKARKFTGTDGLNLGTTTITSEYTIIAMFNPNSVGLNLSTYPTKIIGTTTAGSGITIAIDTGTQKFKVYDGANSAVFNSRINENTTNFLATTNKNNTQSAYVNSITPEITPLARSPVSQVLSTVAVGSTYYSFLGIFEYLAIIPRALSQAEITVIYNKLMKQKIRNIIDDMLPANSIALGLARTDSTRVVEIVDSSDPKGKVPDYAYGIRIGATGDNKRKFLGWRYFNSAMNPQPWDNPFGTRRIKKVFVWAQDANGTNESETCQIYYDSTVSKYFGVYYLPDVTNKIKVQLMQGGVTFFNNAWQTSGFLGCYVECLEDD